MSKKLFLLDGMALVYRAHFAFASRPILTSQGMNTSAIFGFTQTLLDILKTQQPTHVAVVFDTDKPTHRSELYAEYKAHREAMPEDLSRALPHVRRLIEAFRIPVITCDGWEADDVIGTLARQAEAEGFETYMVTPDKDFGQLVTARTFLFRPSRMGDGAEILGVAEVLQRWGIQNTSQVVDLLGLMGDSSDNIPGVPGIGEKTAARLLTEHGTMENLLAHTAALKGKLRETLEANRELALLSKKLATIDCHAPCPVALESLAVQPPDDEQLKGLCREFEFNTIGRRLFGDGFKAAPGARPVPAAAEAGPSAGRGGGEPEAAPDGFVVLTEPAPPAAVRTIAEVPHRYRIAATPGERAELVALLSARTCFCFDTETTDLDHKAARLVGIAFSWEAGTGWYVPVPQETDAGRAVLEEFRAVLESPAIEKVGHNLKFDLCVLRWHGVTVRGPLFDTMIAHSLVEPEMRHGMDYLSAVYLGYAPIPISRLIGDGKDQLFTMAHVPVEQVAEYAAEDADVTWQLRGVMEPLLRERRQERVFFEMEMPLLPVLVEMEVEGIRVEAAALGEIGAQMGAQIATLEKTIHRLAGTEFNVNSTRQLGTILFETLRISDSPKKTRTGLYATDEQTLMALAPGHEIVQRLLEYRELTKLKSTYVDALPQAIWPATGRVHTNFQQAMTATGRLSSQNPNLQNIPIRTEAGREIRKAFVPRDERHLLLSADYSQIELRIIAALSREEGLIEAFRTGADVHSATAARVYGVALEAVTPEMRRKAKMVNYGIAYGISAFGLAQRLSIPRKEAATIIDQYFTQFPGIRRYMNETIEGARQKGYVETVTGRRRYLRDIRSANAAVRGAAERNAINMPIQGTAADMIKIAMARIHQALEKGRFRTRLLLQVHDELVFDLERGESDAILPLVRDLMQNAIPLGVPIEVDLGTGTDWLQAH